MGLLRSVHHVYLSALLLSATLMDVSLLVSTSPAITFETFEEQAVGTVIGTVRNDLVFRRRIQYSDLSNLRFVFLPQGYPSTKYITIANKTGVISNTRDLDRESLCLSKQFECVLDLLLSVRSQSGDYFQVIPIGIKVLDINDNKPSFPKKVITLQVSESTSIDNEFQIPHASDPDQGLNGIVTYTLHPIGNPFHLKVSKTSQLRVGLSIVLRKKLDREKTQRYSLSLLAQDRGDPSQSDSLYIAIVVTDVNDNRPVFSQDAYSVNVLENITVSSDIVQVNATDADLGLNSQLIYRFDYVTDSQYGHVFIINETTGVIQISRELDYESQPLYELTIECSDTGIPPQVSQIVVMVNVHDVNDNSPVIHFNVLVDIPEDAKLNSYLAHITVTDADSGENGHALCVLNASDFILSRLYGNEFQLLLNRHLDREFNPVLYCSITCSDNGTEPLVSQRGVYIMVNDVNEYAPVFQQEVYELTVIENCDVHSAIITVHATDKDSEYGVVTYAILNVQSPSTFKIHQDTGVIITNGMLDRETKSKYTLEVSAMDNGLPPLSVSAIVRVTVLDENDNAPKCDSPEEEFHIRENLPEDTILGKISASDADVGDNGYVNYFIAINDSSSSSFEINSKTGVIKTLRSFDRERQGLYVISIDARDNGDLSLTGRCVIKVYITDEDDNIPEIVFPSELNDTVNVTLPLLERDCVATVIAYDLDEGRNGEIKFMITDGNADELFLIHNTNGCITMARQICVEMEEVRYLNISVQNPDSLFSANATLVIFFTKNNITGLVRITEQPSISADYVAIVVSLVSIASIATILIVSIVCIVLRRRNRRLHIYSVTNETLKSMIPCSDESLYQENSTYDVRRLNNQTSVIVCTSHAEPQCRRLSLSSEIEVSPAKNKNDRTTVNEHMSPKQIRTLQEHCSMATLNDLFTSPRACSSRTDNRKVINRITSLESCRSNGNDVSPSDHLRAVLHNWMITRGHTIHEALNLFSEVQNSPTRQRANPAPDREWASVALSEKSNDSSSDSGHGPSEEEICYHISDVENGFGTKVGSNVRRNISFQFAVDPRFTHITDKHQHKRVRFNVTSLEEELREHAVTQDLDVKTGKRTFLQTDI